MTPAAASDRPRVHSLQQNDGRPAPYRCLVGPTGWLPRIALVLIFAWSAISKAIDPSGAQVLLEQYTNARLSSLLSTALWSYEYWLALALLALYRSSIPIFVSMLTLACFTAFLVHSKLSGFQGSCGCMAGLDLTVDQAIVRNGIFLVGIGLLLMPFGSTTFQETHNDA